MNIKRLKSRYNDKKVTPGIKDYILEHIHNLNMVFVALERAEVTITGEKSQFFQAHINIVGYICDANGRDPNTSKVLKIFD